MGKTVLLYVLTAVVFFAIDFIWLSTSNSRFYKANLGDLMLARPNVAAAVGFYLLYLVGVLALVVFPALRAGSVGQAVWKGALFGLVAYATYDLTNLATLKGWSGKVTVVDMIWGTFLTGIVSLISYYLGHWLKV